MNKNQLINMQLEKTANYQKVSKKIRWLSEIIDFIGRYTHSLIIGGSVNFGDLKHLDKIEKLMDECLKLSKRLNSEIIKYTEQNKITFKKDNIPFFFLQKIKGKEASKLKYPEFEYPLSFFLWTIDNLHRTWTNYIPKNSLPLLDKIYNYILIPPGLDNIHKFLDIHTQWRIDNDSLFREQYERSAIYQDWLKGIKQGAYTSKSPPTLAESAPVDDKAISVKQKEVNHEAPSSAQLIQPGPSSQEQIPIVVGAQQLEWKDFINQLLEVYYQIKDSNDFRAKTRFSAGFRTIDAVNTGLRQMGKRVDLEFADDPQGIYWAVKWMGDIYAFLPRKDMVIRAAHLDLAGLEEFYECKGFQPGCSYSKFDIQDVARVEIDSKLSIKLQHKGIILFNDPVP